MAKFTTRIQLQEANENDYKELRSVLEKQSAVKNKRAPMKTTVNNVGEYTLDGNLSIQEVTHIVVKAVTKIGKKFSFTIIRNKHANGYEKLN